MWLSGLEAVKNKIGVKAIYDLSATPFFLKGSGYPEGTLFPWVVSDFSLVDAIEAGIVKVPRVPVADNSMTGEQPTYRDLWLRIREDLPKKGRKTDAIGGAPKLPAELQGALHSLYDNYRQSFERWEANADAQARGSDAAGVRRRLQQHERVEDGVRLRRGMDEDARGRRRDRRAGCSGRCSTTSRTAAGLRGQTRFSWIREQLESGEGMSAEFKKIAAVEIEEFKAEYRARFPGRSADDLTRRRPPARGDEHCRKGGETRRARALRRVGIDADRRLGREHRDAHSWRPRLRHAAAVRAGRRTRSSPNELRRERSRASSTRSTPRCTACRSRSSHAPARPRIRSRVRCRRAFAHWKSASRARSRSRGSSGIATTCPASGCPRRFTADSRLALSTADIPTRTENAPIVGEAQHPHARRSEAATRERGRVPAREAHAGEVLPAGQRAEDRSALRPSLRRRRARLAVSAGPGHREAMACRMRHLQGQHVSAAAPARSSSLTTPPTASTRPSSRARPGRLRSSRSCGPTSPKDRHATWTSTRPRPSTPQRPKNVTCLMSWRTPVHGNRSWRRRWRRCRRCPRT